MLWISRKTDAMGFARLADVPETPLGSLADHESPMTTSALRR
jgi:hypothetical protein